MGRTTRQRAVTVPRGFRGAGTTCGIKPSGQPDLALIVSDRPCSAAGVFTRNKVPGAAVVLSRRHLRAPAARAIVCNSGISNVGTGGRGLGDARHMAEQTAEFLGCSPREILVASTGIIGTFLPMDKIGRGIATAVSKLGRGPAADAQAARAILTTDLKTKMATRKLRIGTRMVTIGGMAKGSGMIAPNMATMLAFITTDAAIATDTLRRALRSAADTTFNRISIDADTSTSDSVFVLANGAAGNNTIGARGAAFGRFEQALRDLCHDLATQLVRDGEGATKIFHVIVNRAASDRDAERLGRTVVESPLVKTAVHGGDPNWGRLIMAAGRSGAAIDPKRLSAHIGNICVFRRGEAVQIDRPTRRRLERYMRRKEITFTVDAGLGRSTTEWSGCDLSRQYVTINADYTT